MSPTESQHRTIKNRYEGDWGRDEKVQTEVAWTGRTEGCKGIADRVETCSNLMVNQTAPVMSADTLSWELTHEMRKTM